MPTSPLNLLLADDDEDDCMFFEEALMELPIASNLTTVNDGVELMELLNRMQGKIPDALFLDLNMPRKSGYECLSEIKLSKKLKHLPVIIYSTSLDPDKVDSLYETGAYHYIRKPGDFKKLKKIIHQALAMLDNVEPKKPLKERFVIRD